MDPSLRILDQPQSIDYIPDGEPLTYSLANQDITFTADGNADLHDLFWPWADAAYVRSVTIQLSAPREDEFMPMVTRLYPGQLEAIYGTEGVIVGKVLVAPLKSAYDRSAIWLLECQAEGDRLLRIEIDIDWGEPLSQRMVDGLLVAQRNPRPAQGIYAQQNAESTRVFGNPEGRPDFVDIEDDQHAKLVYHVLINGIVEVPLLLVVSDVGEQVAWNGFLALRDGKIVTQKSTSHWEKLLKTGRLWTPDPNLNQAVQIGQVLTMRHLQRLRTGIAPTDRQVQAVPTLVDSLDTFDVTLSRNLLAQLRRTAEKGQGRLPEVLPLRMKDSPDDPGPQLIQTNYTYLSALNLHMQHHFDAELLAQHYDAVQQCTERLLQSRQRYELDGVALQKVVGGLRYAITLAHLQKDDVNMVRWESEAHEFARLSSNTRGSKASPEVWLEKWETESGWRLDNELAWHFVEPQRGIKLVGQAIWHGCGLVWKDNDLWVQHNWPDQWHWWALLNLPMNDGHISLVWDGTSLHSTQAVKSELPLEIHHRIHALNTGEFDFDLEFVFIDETDGQERRQLFKPKFV